MISRFRRPSPSVVLAAVLAMPAQKPAGDVQKVTDPSGREVSYPTRLAEVVTGATSGRAIKPPFAVADGEAVLTKAALTHVRMRPGEPDAVLFQNTFVRFDTTNRWLLRQGATFIVNRRGKLAVVVEGLETLFVGSGVYVEVTDQGLLVYVFEGSVMLGATASGITLGPSQAGRVARGGVPERTVPNPGEQARIERQTRIARTLMSTPKPGGGAPIVPVILALGAAGAGVYVLTHQNKPDLVPIVSRSGGFCELQGNTVVVSVSNQGEKDAPDSLTQVTVRDDSRFGTAVLPTRAVAAGDVTQVALPRPPACFPCRIQITADSAGQVKESNEGNNGVEGVCYGGPG